MSNKLLFNAATSRFLLAAYVLVLMPELHPGLVRALAGRPRSCHGTLYDPSEPEHRAP